MQRGVQAATFVFLALIAFAVPAQTLYKYLGENGEWIYSDRPPDDSEDVSETRNLSTGEVRGTVSVESRAGSGVIDLVANNRFHIPVELRIVFKRLRGLSYPESDQELFWVLPPRSESTVLRLTVTGEVAAPEAEYGYEYRAGDPRSTHRPTALYRVPFSIASEFPVTQAYPDVTTHRTPDSYYAVDIAMPIGTDIVAARDGIVFDVAESNFQSGLDPERDGPAANVIQIMHDDGTYAVYAHLNWNSIRVRPGDRVVRGEYIADSGNTGFSSGPHLHFVVLHNSPNGIVSVPVQFEGANSSAVMPSSGVMLTAY